jgi:2'-5' RNA ligase
MRCFVAIEPDIGTRERIRAARVEWEGRLPGWRFLAPEGIDLTLKFLGETRPEIAARLAEDLRRACAEVAPLRYRLAGLGAFPPRGAPRVLWVGAVDSDGDRALENLAALVEVVARAHGWASESRPFHPHVTVARARRGVRPERPAVGAAFDGGVVEARSAVLLESELLPDGSRYRERARFPLAGPRAETGT